MKDEFADIRVPIAKDNPSIYRIEEKCIKCGACKGICKIRIGVYGNYDLDEVEEPICIHCGQCRLVCPVNSIEGVCDYPQVKEAIQEGKKVVFQVAPAVRVALGEEFGLKPGVNVEKKIVTALKKLGASYVFDTTFGADLTIMEEGSELVKRLKNKENIPMFTSCCPGWVKYCEIFYPELIPNLSTAKSPISMQGAMIKTYFAEKENIPKEDIVSVAVTPCVAKKYEINREEFHHDVDYVITTSELAMWLKEEKIDLPNLEDEEFDQIMSRGSGGGLIFGNSGGVMESALRYVNYLLTGTKNNDKLLNLEPVRGLQDIKEATITIGDYNLKVAVINGTGDAKKLITKIKEENLYYDFIEVMACDGGCIAGGGQPKANFPITNEIKEERIKGLYNLDEKNKIRNCFENPDIINIYQEYLDKPLSPKAERLLHTTYKDCHEMLKAKINN